MTMKNKICFIMTDAISYKMLCRDQLEYFRDNTDFQITLVAGGKKENIKELIERNVGIVYDARFIRKPSLLNDLKSLIYLTIFIYNNKFDLIVYSTPKALLLGSIATLVTRQKNSIAIIQGRAYENYTGRKRSIYQALDKLSLASSKHVIFVSNSLESKYLNEKLVNPKKSNVLGGGSFNGVNIDKFHKENKCNLDFPNLFKVLIAGRICYDKGLLDFFKILQYIDNPNIVFQLVGPVEDRESKLLLHEIISNYPNVEHTPYNDSIENFFKNANLHLFLTHREGFGNVAIEAASCGVPTFSYDVVGVKDSVKDGVSGKKFPFQDFKAIAHAVCEASKDPDFNNKYPNARKWVVENFEQEKVWKDYLNFYNKILNENS